MKIQQNKEYKMAYSMDSKVGDLLKDPQAVKVFEKHAPGISRNPMITLAKGMTLKALVAMPQARQAGITEKMIIDIVGEVNALK
jgi:hypothetical protein